ncbi:SNF2-related protein [Vibrio diabolicus]|uniref:SNF2-related protein n=1 Tax=Vibrio diabolicus TaxID=50719 RepID=UPI003D7E0FC4
MLEKLRSAVLGANSHSELLSVFNTYSISITPESLKTASARVRANELAQSILKRVKGDFSQITEEEREQLRDYSGWGGIGGSTNEYYTPKWVASAVWEAMSAYGFNGGSILEPAAGVGVFSETKPDNALMTSVEMDPTSSAINQILHPDDNVISSGFEAVATDPHNGNYDVVTGNPPYGDRSDTIAEDSEYKDVKKNEQYFVLRSIDKAKPGGLIALVLPTQICDSSKLKRFRTRTAMKAEFLGAHRLPSGVFDGSSVVTDLVIWRKHSEDAAERIANADKNTLVESNVLWSDWIDGHWFDREGKRFINGTQTIGFQGRKLVDRGNRSNEQIAKALSHKFESRIEWDQLDTVEPISDKYSDGDTIFHNGQQMEYIAGQWHPVHVTEQQKTLDVASYGIEHIDGIGDATSTTKAMSKLTAEQAIALNDDYGHLCHGEFKTIVANIKKLPPRAREKAYKGILIGKQIEQLQNVIELSRTDNELSINNDEVSALRTKLSADVMAMHMQHGRNLPAGIKGIDDKLTSHWLRYQNSVSKDGQLSDLLTGELTVIKAEQYDMSRIDDVLHFFEHDKGMSSVRLTDIRMAYLNEASQLDDDKLTKHLAGMENVAVNRDGSFSPMRVATSGNVAAKKRNLSEAVANTDSEVLRANYIKQINTIDEKRNTIPINQIKMKLTDKWIPKRIMLEFLHDQGYTEFQLGRFVVDEQGFEDFVADGDGDTFTGYRWRDGKKVSSQDEAFERQVESYLNNGSVRGGSDNEQKAIVRERMRNLDRDFTNWCASSVYADELEGDYNDAFNGWIEPTYETTSIDLEDVSGAIKFMPYQNATIRKHAADGNGILALGTGLGKTLTALGLGQYLIQHNKASRIAYVMPKSVLDNWLFESDIFFGEANLKNKVFIGIEFERDDDGALVREVALDEDGNERKDAKGDLIKRPKIKVNTNGKKIAEQLHALAQSSAQMVFMTKDVYNSIPLKPATITENVENMVDAGLVAGSNKYAKEAKTYREAQKNAKFKQKHSDDGTAKKETLPYFEDLLFDSVIVDEGHDFRNSYKMGGYGNRLAYLPNAAQANRALDMQIKNNHIKSRNDGRGVYMLTATPTVNSPVDLFNMLSQVLPPQTLADMGIVDADDFIRLFGHTGETAVTKLSGEVDTREALLGFQNLDALRSIFRRYTTAMSAEDVRSDVHVPTLKSMTNVVEMSDEQKEVYEELRQRADALSNPDEPENQEIIEQYPNDSVFSLIRMMDKANTDMDLYHGVVTYRFNKDDKSKVDEVVDKLPKTIKVRREKLDDEGEPVLNAAGQAVTETVEIEANYQINTDGKFLELKLAQELDGQFSKLCSDAGLKFSHPVSPKYAKFLETAKASYLAGGKQLIFTEEKTQHVKIARMVADYIGCDMSEIGILNSDTVAGKKGSKATEDDEEAGLAALEKAYNSSKYKFMILNKKGEVGVNLHRGTTDIHHLTLPWTPSSLTQRNGRGARVGSKAANVNVHYYAGKGSFDQFRIETIERKARWIQDLFSGDESYVENGSADDGSETSIMLAADPELAKARIEQARIERERRIKREEQRQAAINVSKYVQASIAANTDLDPIRQRLQELVEEIETQTERTKDAEENAQGEKRNSYEYRRFKSEKDSLFRLTKERAELQKTIKLSNEAGNAIKRLKSVIEASVKDGTLAGYDDITTHPELYATKNGVVLRKGFTYHVNVPTHYWKEDGEHEEYILTLSEFNRNEGTATGIIVSKPNEQNPTASAGSRKSNIAFEKWYQLADVNQSEQELASRVASGIPLSAIPSTIDRETFFDFHKRGLLSKYGHHKTPLVYLTNGRVKQLDSMEIPDGAFLIYPDPSDESLVKALIAQASADLESRGIVTFCEHGTIKALVGDDWMQQAQSGGNVATQSDVVAAVQNAINTVERDEANQPYLESDLIEAASSYMISRIRVVEWVQNELNALDWTGYSNRNQIRGYISDAMKDYRSAFKERGRIKRQEVIDKLFADYIALVKSDPSRKERLIKLNESMQRRKRSHDFINDIDALYPDDNSAIVSAYADLTVTERHAQLEGGEALLATASYSRRNALDKWDSVRLNYRNVFDQKIDELYGEKETPELEPVITDRQKEKVEQVLSVDFEGVDTLKTELAKIGITVQPVTQDLSWKYKRKTISIKAYEGIGLQDINEKQGALAKLLMGRKNADNKEKYGAKFNSDPSNDFVGAWWFIDSESDLESFYQDIMAVA